MYTNILIFNTKKIVSPFVWIYNVFVTMQSVAQSYCFVNTCIDINCMTTVMILSEINITKVYSIVSK